MHGLCLFVFLSLKANAVEGDKDKITVSWKT